MIWIVWIFNQYFILVIMLNFLISVISDTYQNIMQHSQMYTYRYRNELNVEYLLMKDLFFASQDVEIIIVVTDKELYQTKEDDLENIQNHIVETIKDQF